MADSSAVQKLSKPQLRGLLKSNFRRHAIIAAAFCTVNVILFKTFVVDRRRKAYADFYKNYDAEKEFEEMKKTGVFESVAPDLKL